MAKKLLACLGAVYLSAIVYGQTSSTPAPTAGPSQPSSVSASSTASPYPASQRALINQYCVGCHNQRTKAGDLTLDQLDLAQIGDHTEAWEKVVRKLRAGMMPPSGVRRPDAATLEGLT